MLAMAYFIVNFHIRNEEMVTEVIGHKYFCTERTFLLCRDGFLKGCKFHKGFHSTLFEDIVIELSVFLSLHALISIYNNFIPK